MPGVLFMSKERIFFRDVVVRKNVCFSMCEGIFPSGVASFFKKSENSLTVS